MEQKKRIPAMVIITILIVISLLFAAITWSINFKSIVPEDATNEEKLGGVFAILILSVPFLLSLLGEAILLIIATPLSFALLRKSCVPALSKFGTIYGIASIVLLLAAVGRFLLFYFMIY